jgi:HsdM N-terminal domain
MPIKKSELYSSLWKSCDELRGGMDASQYKDYVLVFSSSSNTSPTSMQGRRTLSWTCLLAAASPPWSG